MAHDQPLMIVASSTAKQKDKRFFILLQSEFGDLYKATLEITNKITAQGQLQTVDSVVLQYFDTVPTANSLSIMRSGMLFVASEFGNQYF